MNCRFWKKTAAAAVALLIVTGSLPIQPVRDTVRDLSMTAVAVGSYADTELTYHADTQTLVLAGDVDAAAINNALSDASIEDGSVDVVVSSNGANINAKELFRYNMKIRSVDLTGAVLTNDRTYCMFYNCQNLKSIDLGDLDTSGVTSMSGMFLNCDNMTSLDLGSRFCTDNVTNMTQMFGYCRNLKSLDLTGFNTSKVTKMAKMFEDCYSLTELDVSMFDTSNVTDMKNMFMVCGQLTELDLRNFDTSKVTDMSSMFSLCENLKHIRLGEKFKTDKVTDMGAMFRSCERLEEINLSGFDTSNVTTMQLMFAECKKLSELDVSKFDTSNVTNMSSMFSDCQLISSLDLRSFNTSKVTDMSFMFSGCYALESISISDGWNIENVIFADEVFWGCNKLSSKPPVPENNYTYEFDDETGELIMTGGRTVPSVPFRDRDDITSLIIDEYSGIVGIGSAAFRNCSELQTVTIPASVTDISWMAFLYCENVEDVYLYSDPDTLNWVSTTSDFSRSKSTTIHTYQDYFDKYNALVGDKFTVIGDLGSVPRSSYDDEATTYYEAYHTLVLAGEVGENSIAEALSGYNVEDGSVNIVVSTKGAVLSSNKAFNGCSHMIKSIDLTGASLGITDLSGLFKGCDKAVKIDLGSINTSSVTNMSEMFSGCNTLRHIDLGSNFSTGNVTYMNNMFYNCRSLKTLDLSGFDTSNVTDMKDMFNGCSKLDSLDLSSFATSKVTDMRSMFEWCVNLQDLDLRSFNTSKVTDMTCMFMGCNSLKKLDLSSFDTSKVTSMSYMFYCDYLLKRIYVSDKWSTEKVANGNDMFRSAGVLTGVNGTKYSDEHTGLEYARIDTAETPGYFTRGYNNTSTQYFSDTQKLVLAGDVYYSDIAAALNDPSIPDGSVDVVVSAKGAFLADDTNSVLGSGVRDKLRSIDLTGAVLSPDVRKLEYFHDAPNLAEVRFGDIDTSYITSMQGLFSGCTDLKKVDFGISFSTVSVTDMSYMFTNCTELEELDLTSFDTANVETMHGMFYNCSSLKTIRVSNDWNTDKLTTDDSKTNTFYGCEGLAGGKGTGFDALKISADYAKIDTADTPGYLTKGYNNTETMYDEEEKTLVLAGEVDSSTVNNMIYGIDDDEISVVVSAKGASLDCERLFNRCDKIVSADLSGAVLSGYSMQSMFGDCDNLKTVNFGNMETDGLIVATQIFFECRSLTSVNFGSIDTSDLENCLGAFDGCWELETIDLSDLSGKSIRDTREMFRSCTSLKTIIPFKDTAKPHLIEEMFSGCRSLTELDLRWLDTSEVDDMHELFSNCHSLESIDLSSFDTSKVNDMHNMFEGCNKLETIDLSSFDTSEVTNIDEMFNGCISLKTITVGANWKTDKMVLTCNAFSMCDELENPPAIPENNFTYSFDSETGVLTLKTGLSVDPDIIPNGIRSKIKSIVFDDESTIRGIDKDAFSGCTSLETVTIPAQITDVGHRNTSNSGAFDRCEKIKDIYLYAEPEKITTIWYPGDFTSDTKIHVLSKYLEKYEKKYENSGFNGQIAGDLDDIARAGYNDAVTTYHEDTNTLVLAGEIGEGTVYDALNDNSIEAGSVYVVVSGKGAELTTNYAFTSNSKIYSVDLTGAAISTTNMNGMFSNCQSLETVDLGDLDTSSVESMCGLFSGCSSLESISFGSGLNTSNVTDMSDMFNGCEALEELDLRGFDTRKVRLMNKMFIDCFDLTTITVGRKWSTESVTYSNEMFHGCFELVGENGTWYSDAHTDAEYARIDNGETKGYLTAAAITYIDENGELQTVPSAVPLTGDEAYLPTGWYIVDENISFDHMLEVENVNIILYDGCTMTVNAKNEPAVSGDNSLNIYGQSRQTGTLSAVSENNSAVNVPELNIYGGNISAEGVSGIETSTALNICGGRVTAEASSADGCALKSSNELNISGGKITVNGGIFGKTTELSCRGADDFINADEYKLTCSDVNGTYKVAEKCNLADKPGNIYSGSLDSEQLAAMAGTKLTGAGKVSFAEGFADFLTVEVDYGNKAAIFSGTDEIFAPIGAKILLRADSHDYEYGYNSYFEAGTDPTVTCGNGQTVEVSRINNTGEYTFIMPSGNVTANGVAYAYFFRKDPTCLEEGHIEHTRYSDGRLYDGYYEPVSENDIILPKTDHSPAANHQRFVWSRNTDHFDVTLYLYCETCREEIAVGTTEVPYNTEKVYEAVIYYDGEEYTDEFSENIPSDEPRVKIGETSYSTLREAIEASQSGDTITILDNIYEVDVNCDVGDKNLTFELNGNQVSLGSLTTSGDLTIRGGTLICEIKNANKNSDKSLTLNNAILILDKLEWTARNIVLINNSSLNITISAFLGGETDDSLDLDIDSTSEICLINDVRITGNSAELVRETINSYLLNGYSIDDYGFIRDPYDSRTYAKLTPQNIGKLDVSDYKSEGTEPEAPTEDGKLFAGWFNDSTCNESYTEDYDYAYAKFIDADCLTVKYQMPVGFESKESSDIRLITSLDCGSYDSLHITLRFADTGKLIADGEINTIYTTLNGYDKEGENPTAYNASEVFCKDSNFFGAIIVEGMPSTVYSAELIAQAYFVTQDGTRVYGRENRFKALNNE